ncbi:MAG: four helix bundle protein [Terracidiphilus sp.]
MREAGQQVSKSAGQRGSEMTGKEQNAPAHGRTRHYRELLVWQKAMELARHVYRETEALPKTENYGLLLQMRRAAVSIPSNIAEGHGRLKDGYLRQFLGTARGSLFELQTQMELAGDMRYLSEDATAQLMEQSEEVARWINGLPAKLES